MNKGVTLKDDMMEINLRFGMYKVLMNGVIHTKFSQQ